AYDARVAQALGPGMRILDVGSGRTPSLAPDARPPGCHYVGLDVSSVELEAAPSGWYDEIVVADVAQRVPELEGRFDLVVSLQVLEHVRPLPVAMENLRSYLAPGGCLIAQLSGAYSVYGVVNRLIPQSVALWLLKHLLARPVDTVFPAYYHRCHSRGLNQIFANWSAAEVHSEWWGAGYFAFSRPLQSIYVGFEEWIRLSGYTNLAPYYVVEART
ncbi:MAG: class I SAM-dependent methyltransferase, partial [Pseudonocardiaceae bacterium]